MFVDVSEQAGFSWLGKCNESLLFQHFNLFPYRQLSQLVHYRIKKKPFQEIRMCLCLSAWGPTDGLTT